MIVLDKTHVETARRMKILPHSSSLRKIPDRHQIPRVLRSGHRELMFAQLSSLPVRVLFENANQILSVAGFREGCRQPPEVL